MSADHSAMQGDDRKTEKGPSFLQAEIQEREAEITGVGSGSVRRDRQYVAMVLVLE